MLLHEQKNTINSKKGEHDMSEQSLELMKHLWTMLSLPLVWLWSRINTNHKETRKTLDDMARAVDESDKELERHKLHVANKYFEKDEVKDIVRGSIEPLKDSLDRIDSNIQTLMNQKMSGK